MPVTKKRPLVVLTDYSYETIQPFIDVYKAADFEFRPCQCKSPEEIIEACKDADAIQVHFAEITRDILAALPKCRLLVHSGVGMDTIDVDAARDLGIPACNVPDYGIEDVATHTILLMLAVTKKLNKLMDTVKRGVWDFSVAKPVHRLAGRTFGTIGCGAIACSTIQKEKDTVRGTILKKAFRIGFPVALQEVFLCAAMVVQTRIIAPLGAVAVAANSFAVTAEGFCYMPGYGLGAAAATLVGRSVGAGETRLARQQGNICTAMGALFMAVTAGIMALICPWVFRLLTPDESVRALATQVLRIALLAEPLYGVSIVAAGALRGTGDTLVPSIMNLCSIWIVRLGLALVLVPRMGLRGMWIAMAVELCVRGLLMLFRQLTTKYYEKYKKEPV